MKKIVILYNKHTGEETPFSSVSRLVRETSKEILGIGLGALYNALSQNNGEYENARVKVCYKHIETKPKVWE